MALYTINNSRQKDGANFPSIADSNFPTSNRIDGTNGTVNYIYTDNSGDVFYANYIFPAEAPADTCTYSSGNWNIDCSDNCVISSNVLVDGSDIILTGTGTFLINTNVKITGWNYLREDRTCYIKASGSGGFY